MTLMIVGPDDSSCLRCFQKPGGKIYLTHWSWNHWYFNWDCVYFLWVTFLRLEGGRLLWQVISLPISQTSLGVWLCMDKRWIVSLCTQPLCQCHHSLCFSVTSLSLDHIPKMADLRHVSYLFVYCLPCELLTYSLLQSSSFEWKVWCVVCGVDLQR